MTSRRLTRPQSVRPHGPQAHRYPTRRSRWQIAPFAMLTSAAMASASVLTTTALTFTNVSPAGAQTIEEVTASPSETADLFIRSVRAIRWGTAAQFLHPETLDRFHWLVSAIAVADSTGEMRTFLTQSDSVGFAALTPEEVFDRSIGAMIDDMPGLMHSIYDRDDDVIGHVIEQTDTAHVVYRTTARISGAVSEVKVMQVLRTPRGWRVFWSDELEVLDAALRGFFRR